MNGAQCVICTESLESANDAVSAVQCGHVFHGRCLARWLTESSTCPQCRVKVTAKGVISKLFFCLPDNQEASQADEDGGLRKATTEIRRLNDELGNARISLSEKARELDKLSAVTRALEQKSVNLTETLRSLESLHQKELDSNKLLRLQLATAQALAREADEARDVVSVLRRKVNELQNVQNVINGFQDEIDTMIRDTSDMTQLATWCTVLKSELAHKRKECRELKETLQQTKRNLESARSALSERSSELTVSNSRVANLEVDVAEQNKEISSLRKKIDALQAALASPSDTAAGFARRLINESPAPFASFQTPKLSAPKSGAREIDLDTSADLFATPEPSGKTQAPPVKRSRYNLSAGNTAPDLLVNPVRITSANTANSSSAQSREPENISKRPVLLALNIIDKKGQADAAKRFQSGVFREGYNGFGGHEKVIMPRPKLLSSSSAAGSKKPVKKMFGPSKTSSFLTDKKMPPLPTLLSFMSNNNSDDLT